MGRPALLLLLLLGLPVLRCMLLVDCMLLPRRRNWIKAGQVSNANYSALVA
jgi:hypothetical protein